MKRVHVLSSTEYPPARKLALSLISQFHHESVYSTYLEVNKVLYIFETTNKNIHLQLGKLENVTRRELAEFLRAEIGEVKRDVLIFQDEEKKNGFLVTLAANSNDEYVRFTLSPAN
ncbi:MAG: hypothetical protein NUV78_01635 [Candidatus Zambryskibacteria bacterium]|nr:hypothetical protein [Candidatus Zambryskibacteria bacterium]